MNFYKERSVKSPTKGTKLSAGIDFYVPEFTESFLSDFIKKNNVAYSSYDKCFIIRPMQQILIPSGIKVKIKDNQVLIAFNKSGVSTKKGLIKVAEVVDADYQGEIHISLLNTSKKDIKVCEGEKIIQFILIDLPEDDGLNEMNSIEELYSEESERKDGGFGSTNK